MKARTSIKGFIFYGLMMLRQPYVIEYNARRRPKLIGNYAPKSDFVELLTVCAKAN